MVWKSSSLFDLSSEKYLINNCHRLSDTAFVGGRSPSDDNARSLYYSQVLQVVNDAIHIDKIKVIGALGWAYVDK